MIEWTRNAIGIAGNLMREVGGSFRENWGVGILSIVLAGALWVFVTDRANPEVTRTLSSSVTIEAVNVPTDQAVASLTPSTVRVQVRAPEDVFNDLSPEDFTATVDLSSVATPEASVLVEVETGRARVEIVGKTPAQVRVQLENVTSRTLRLETNLVGAPPPGFQAGNVSIQPEEAVVRGPQSRVENVASIQVDVNLTGLRTNFQQTLIPQARGAGGDPIQGVTIEPESAVVAIEIVQIEFSRVVAVQPDITGSPAPGYIVTGIEVTPTLVTVSGPADVFQALDPVAGVQTEEITIAGASADVVRPVALRLPAGARVEQASVTVRVIIEPIPSNTPSGSP
jgi:YbbR domain-containing protein